MEWLEQLEQLERLKQMEQSTKRSIEGYGDGVLSIKITLFPSPPFIYSNFADLVGACSFLQATKMAATRTVAPRVFQ